MESTQIGKALRKLRIDTEERLLDMAKRLGVSASFLSAVETGKKAMPEELLSKIEEEYGLDGSQMDELWADLSQSKSAFIINAKSAAARDTAGLLARRFEALSEGELANIRKMLRGENNGGHEW